MSSLLLRNLIFTILQPGMVAGLIPFWISGSMSHTVFTKKWALYQIFGVAIFLFGFIILLTCIISFAINGQGTISPVDPTKRLVVTGLYKFSRNPMYVGVMLILIGEAIFFQSHHLAIYSLCIFFAFCIFIFIREEPRLKKDFADQYNVYCKSVRRWI